MKRFVALLLLLSFMVCKADSDDMILCVGAGGQEEYSEQFAKWAKQWKQAARAAKIDIVAEIGMTGEASQDYDSFQQSIDKHAGESNSVLWLVLLGHGTFDRGTAKFNLRGKDIESKELNSWLVQCKRPLVVVNGFSCSGAFLQSLQGEDRVVITATKAGSELNFSRFGGFLAEAMGNMDADLDHDDQVSLLESFLFASSQVNQFYESDSRLVTEHALLEDNQDGKGISADFFRGIRARGKSKDGSALDGRNAHRFILLASEKAVRLSPEQSEQRDQLEAKIEKLRSQKSKLAVADYYQQLETLMVEMARLYQAG